MARETGLVNKLLAGTVGVAAGYIVGKQAVDYYREKYRQRGTARVICTDCGESLPVDDLLDPTVTCSCVTASDIGDSRPA